MAKKATTKSGGRSKAPAERRSGDRRSGDRRRGSGGRAGSGASDAFVALLQSPLVAELVAAAATAALTALAQEGTRGGSGKRNVVKKAGKAAADAVKRRLSDELDEIKKAAKAAKSSAKG